MGQNEAEPYHGKLPHWVRLFIALWIGAEVVGSILMAVVGPEGSAWLVGVSALISIVFAMVYGSIRVLTGHDL